MYVLEVIMGDEGLVIKVETTETVGRFRGSVRSAQPQDRTTSWVRDLALLRRPLGADGSIAAARV